MNYRKREPDDEGLLKAFRQEEARLLSSRTMIGAILVCCVVPGGLLLDYFVYPNFQTSLLVVRATCVVATGMVVVLLWRFRFSDRQSHLVAMGWLFVILSYNAWLIYVTDGVLSPYYTGILLTILGASILFPWRAREMALACFLGMVVYGAACWGNWIFVGPPSNMKWSATLFNNGYMLMTANVLCTTACYFSERRRFHLFKLQYELDQSKTELETSYRKLEDQDQAKSAFMANVSHEFRTPLTLIIAPLENLLASEEVQSQSDVHDTLGVMQKNAMRLLALINDLLDLLKLEEGVLNVTPVSVDLAQLLSGMVASVQGLASKSGLTVECECTQDVACMAHVDPNQIEKVFLNLLINAIKFTPRGGEVFVRWREEKDEVCVEFQDTGFGIDQDKLSSIFKRFWQVDGSSTRARQGTGIGLSLVKDIVDQHRGRIEVDSEKGVGSTFRIWLPEGKESVPEATPVDEDRWLTELHQQAKLHGEELAIPTEQSPIRDDRNPIRYTLLLVEDEPSMQNFLFMELKSKYNVVVASDGEQGFALAQEHQPDLVLTDMMLPRMDGLELCRRLRTLPSLAFTRIVMLTARTDEMTKLSTLRAGASDFLTKPFSTIELKTRLDNLLLGAGLERQLQAKNQELEETLGELRAAEAQLIRTERLSAIGNLSAGIMHEVNNPINFMISAVGYLKRENAGRDAVVEESANDIEEGLLRIRDIVADLKSFAHPAGSDSREVLLPSEMLSVCRRLLSGEDVQDIEWCEEFEEGVTLYCNKNQMIQLMLNLLQNAYNATSGNRDLGRDRKIRIAIVRDQAGVKLTVRDNGTGVSDDVKRNMFDPFFTTKDVGEGTGLGLSICHTIVKNHGGQISVNSEVGEFCEFSVTLPTEVGHRELAVTHSSQIQA